MTWATVHTYLPWLLSVITLYMTFLAGSLHRKTWVVGLSNQALWFLYTVATWNTTGPASALGMLPLNIGLSIAYYRNHRKWVHAEKAGLPR